MAKQTLTRHTCDRCGKTYAEVDPSPASASKPTPPPLPKLHIQLEHYDEHSSVSPQDAKHDVIAFDDLCPKCHSRVNDLVGQIKLRPDDDGKGVDSAAKPSDKQGKPEVSSKAPDPKTTH